jgi:putative photosynthetic complex assembly protein 2
VESALAAILLALFIWWFATGAVLFLDGLPRRTFRWSILAATALGLAGFAGVWLAPRGDGQSGAYLGFLAAILIWAWGEISFLLGHVTGPRRGPCPPGAQGAARFTYATQAIIHHELMLAGCGLVVAALVHAGANPVALWTFATLWAMRLSTKLNIFLGVPNAAEELLPPHLAYLESYFGPRRVNALFPLFLTVATLATILVAQSAWSARAAGEPATALILVATLMGLAVIEHWLLVLPLRAARLWSWGLASRRVKAAPAAAIMLNPRHLPAPLVRVAEADPAAAKTAQWTDHVPLTGVKP